ncbi:MAG TPA: hypothetical protein VN840_02315 [Streptosporangiaceae bacterium]|nr:hypothetical protein [Streptosporangiaceae bacterium]
MGIDWNTDTDWITGIDRHTELPEQPGGPDADHSLAALELHIHREVIHHGPRSRCRVICI